METRAGLELVSNSATMAKAGYPLMFVHEHDEGAPPLASFDYRLIHTMPNAY